MGCMHRIGGYPMDKTGSDCPAVFAPRVHKELLEWSSGPG